MELKQLSNNTYYIPNSTNIGVITSGSSAILIDSGLDDDTGKKVLQNLERAGMHVKAIINTHSHADHIGGNSYIKAKTGASIYAPDYEASIVHYPYFEPLFLFAGAHPIKDLRNKFLMAKPSKVDFIISPDTRELDIAGIKLSVLPLSGHALNQIGIEYEGTLFCADSVFSIDVLVKHKIPFCVDIVRQKTTLKMLKDSPFCVYVPSHAEPSADLNAVIEAYERTIAGLKSSLLELASTASSSEELLSELCRLLGVNIRNAQQFYLLRTSVMAYLSYLYEEGTLKILISGNRLLWHA